MAIMHASCPTCRAAHERIEDSFQRAVAECKALALKTARSYMPPIARIHIAATTQQSLRDASMPACSLASSPRQRLPKTNVFLKRHMSPSRLKLKKQRRTLLPDLHALNEDESKRDDSQRAAVPVVQCLKQGK
eukprot:IDg22740t1